MKPCRIWISLFLLAALVIGALLQVVRHQRDKIAALTMDKQVILRVNADLSAGIQYLANENQALGAELMKRPRREYRHF